MRLFYCDGRLYTDDGEPIEGIMIDQVKTHPDFDVTTVSFTMILEHMPELKESVQLRAIEGLAKMQQGLAED